MDRSEVKKIFPHPVWGGGGGGVSATKIQSCLKLPEMDRSQLKKFLLIVGVGGLFCHKNPSCSKLPEMDRSQVKKISLILGGGGGGAFLPQKPKLLEIAWNG